MPTSPLSVTRSEIKRFVARKNYWDPASLTSEQTTNLNDIIRSGERSFYYSPVLPGQSKIHVWSFMKPQYNLQTIGSVGDYELPEDYAGFCGNLTFADYLSEITLRETNYSHVLAMRSKSAMQVVFEAQPTMYATYPIAAEAGPAQRVGIALYPTPDQPYLLRGQYVINPAGIGDDTDYPLGGQPHGETLIAACLAASERIMEDAAGVDTQRFYQLLATSISWDRTHSGGRVGPMLTEGPITTRPFDRAQFVTYNGRLDD